MHYIVVFGPPSSPRLLDDVGECGDQEKVPGSLSIVRCEKAFRNGTFKTKQHPIKIKIKIKGSTGKHPEEAQL